MTELRGVTNMPGSSTPVLPAQPAAAHLQASPDAVQEQGGAPQPVTKDHC